MKLNRNVAIILEAVLLGLAIGGANLAAPENPGFGEHYFLPSIASGLLFAVIYGKWFGFLALAMGLIVIAIPFPIVRGLIQSELTLNSLNEYWLNYVRPLIDKLYLPLPIGAVAIFIFGTIRSAALDVEKRLRNKLRELSKNNWLIKRTSSSLLTVNRELEERVSRQQEAITSLYTQIHRLDALDVGNALEVLLETVKIFTKTTKASIWEYDAEDQQLKLAANIGWEPQEKALTNIQLEESIEGWVFRNNNIFSIRMILQYDNLQKMDRGRNIITLPLAAGRKVWGVLNIEAMPFEKYNLYSERLLQIIISLAEHSLERAIDYEAIIQTEETDSSTGLPLFSQFYKVLGEETRRMEAQKGSLTIIVIDIVNHAELSKDHGREKVKSLYPAIVAELDILSDRKAQFFHYKEETQIAIIFPNLDYDGASLFSLESLEKLNSESWRLDEESIPLEAIIGFSVYSGSGGPDQLLEQAEHLLEMQKV